jgi:hypothetical protein
MLEDPGVEDMQANETSSLSGDSVPGMINVSPFGLSLAYLVDRVDLLKYQAALIPTFKLPYESNHVPPPTFFDLTTKELPTQATNHASPLPSVHQSSYSQMPLHAGGAFE